MQVRGKAQTQRTAVFWTERNAVLAVTDTIIKCANVEALAALVPSRRNRRQCREQACAVCGTLASVGIVVGKQVLAVARVSDEHDGADGVEDGIIADSAREYLCRGRGALRVAQKCKLVVWTLLQRSLHSVDNLDSGEAKDMLASVTPFALLDAQKTHINSSRIALLKLSGCLEW